MSDTEIRIGLPLPLDMASTLTTIIGTAYPSARIKTGSGCEMVVLVDAADRRPRLNKRAVAKAKTTTDDPDNESALVAWEDGMPVVSTPEQLSLELGWICAQILDANPDAVNYMEIQVRCDGKQYVVAACRSKGQTPHALRMKAERERDAALAEVERLKQPEDKR